MVEKAAEGPIGVPRPANLLPLSTRSGTEKTWAPAPRCDCQQERRAELCSSEQPYSQAERPVSISTRAGTGELRVLRSDGLLISGGVACSNRLYGKLRRPASGPLALDRTDGQCKGLLELGRVIAAS